MIKPHITRWKGLWECVGLGLHSFDKTPEAAYSRWLEFINRMRVNE